MNQPRTLPIRVQPIPGEALDSWLGAVAHRLQTPLGDLLPEVGLSRQGKGRTIRNNDIPPDWTVLLRPLETAAVANATGVESELVTALTLSRYDGVALRLDHATRQVQRWKLWGRQAASRYCPDCLADSGGRWQLAWRLGWSFACTDHRRLLADSCPACGRAPHHKVLSALPAPGRCLQPLGPSPHVRSSPRCGADLTAASTLRFPEGHPALRAQQLVLDAITEGSAQFGIYAAEPLPTLTMLSDLRALACRILNEAGRNELNDLPSDLLAAFDAHHHPDAFLPTRPRATIGRMAPAQAVVAALGVTAAIKVLGADTVCRAGAELRWLMETSRRRGILVSPSRLRWGHGSSATLTAVQLSALGPLLKPNDQLRYRTAADKPRRPVPGGSASDRHHRVPAMLWMAWAVRLQPSGVGYLRTLRPTLSTMLLLAGTHQSLPEAAGVLGSFSDPQETSRVLQALAAESCWTHILTALTRLTDYLDANRVPIDYHRRRKLDYNALLPDSQWRHICRQTGFAQGLRQRARLARCLLFEKISAMPADRAPASFATTTSEARSLLVELATRTTPDLAAHLDAAAQEFLRQQGVHGEPVEWQPPMSLLAGLTLPGGDPELVDLAALHDFLDEGHSLTTAAQRLGTSFNIARHLLEQHPARPRQRSQEHKGHTRFAHAELPKELLVHLYCDRQLSLQDISQQVGASRTTVCRLAHEYDIPLRRHRPPRVVISRDWLYDQYVTHKRTLLELADETGISATTMIRWARKHKIPLRPRGGPSLKGSRVALAQAAAAPSILRPVLSRAGGWEWLRCFGAIITHPTLSDAAKALGIHPPFLSLQINRLEHDLGGRLLVRAQRGHPMRLTSLGTKVASAIARCSPEEMPSR